MVSLIGRYVEVIANDITYTGKLVEVSETEIHIETDSGWIVIPVEQTACIKEIESRQ